MQRGSSSFSVFAYFDVRKLVQSNKQSEYFQRSSQLCPNFGICGSGGFRGRRWERSPPLREKFFDFSQQKRTKNELIPSQTKLIKKPVFTRSKSHILNAFFDKKRQENGTFFKNAFRTR
jgi:hypothetical protein